MSYRYKVFATCDIGGESLQRLRDRGYEVEIFNKIDPPPKSLILEKIASGIDALITTLRDQLDDEVLCAAKGKVKVIAQDAVGFDNIDRESANRNRIPFTNTSEVLTQATAEFAFFILGCVSRKLYPSENLVRKCEWKTWHPYHPFLGDEVTGKTIGIIGTGRIGKTLARKCSGMDMDILLYDAVFEDQKFVDAIQGLFDESYRVQLAPRRCSIRYGTFEETLKNSDYVSLHVPLAEDTYHLISDKALDLMKSSAYLINTSRGPVVDEEALARALKEGKIGGAALDVFEKEPLPNDSPLRNPEFSDRLRLFHHFASAGRETRLSVDPEVGMAGRCVQAVIDVLEGHYGGNPSQMPYVVNKEGFRDV